MAERYRSLGLGRTVLHDIPAKLGQKLITSRNHIRRHGLRSSLPMLFGQPLENTGLLRIGYCMAYDLRRDTEEPAAAQAGVEIRELSPEEALQLSREGGEWFFPRAVRTSLERGDRCFGLFLDDQLTTSCWCTVLPLHQFGLLLHPPAGGFFSYRGYTREQDRGRGSLGLLRRYVWSVFRAAGYRWHIMTMYWTNTASVKAARKHGCSRIATIVSVGPQPRAWARLYSNAEPRISALSTGEGQNGPTRLDGS